VNARPSNHEHPVSTGGLTALLPGRRAGWFAVAVRLSRFARYRGLNRATMALVHPREALESQDGSDSTAMPPLNSSSVALDVHDDFLQELDLPVRRCGEARRSRAAVRGSLQPGGKRNMRFCQTNPFLKPAPPCRYSGNLTFAAERRKRFLPNEPIFSTPAPPAQSEWKREGENGEWQVVGAPARHVAQAGSRRVNRAKSGVFSGNFRAFPGKRCEGGGGGWRVAGVPPRQVTPARSGRADGAKSGVFSGNFGELQGKI
jgi:hypothetical protein